MAKELSIQSTPKNQRKMSQGRGAGKGVDWYFRCKSQESQPTIEKSRSRQSNQPGEPKIFLKIETETKQWNLIRTEGEKNLRYRMLRGRRESGRDRALQRPPRIYSLRALRLREEGKSNGPGTEEKAKMERECRCRYISAGTGVPCVQVRRSQGRRSVGPQPGLFDDVAVLFHVAAWGLLGSENISCPIFSLGGDDRRGPRRAAPVVNGKISSASGGCQASETRWCAGRAWSLAGCRQGRTRDLKRHFAKNIIRCIVYEQ
jgi:hypothetical protein